MIYGYMTLGDCLAPLSPFVLVATYSSRLVSWVVVPASGTRSQRTEIQALDQGEPTWTPVATHMIALCARIWNRATVMGRHASIPILGAISEFDR